MKQLISDEAGMPLPFHTNYIDAAHEKVKGLQRIPLEHFEGVVLQFGSGRRTGSPVFDNWGKSRRPVTFK